MAYAIAQTVNGGTASGTSFTISMGNTTSGNLIVVVIGVSSTTVSSVADSQLNTYKKATSASANNLDGEIWYAQNIYGGTTPTITVTLTVTAGADGIAREYSGISSRSAFDKATSATGVGGSGDSGATAVTTYGGELVVGGIADGSQTPTAGTGFGNLAKNTTHATNVIGIEDKSVSAPGTQNATFGGTASIWTICVATFVLGGPSTPTNSLRPAIFKPGLAR